MEEDGELKHRQFSLLISVKGLNPIVSIGVQNGVGQRDVNVLGEGGGQGRP